MSYLDRIQACNRHDLGHFRPFRVNRVRVGWVRPGFARELARWPAVFHVSDDEVSLSSELQGFEACSRAVGQVIGALVADGVIHRRHGEPYPVAAEGRAEALLVIDRASAPYFGIRAFGQHLNGFVREGDHLKMWVGRRANDRWNAPGKLDQLVAGGLPHGMSLHENLLKECGEEAAIPRPLAACAVPVGAVSYCAETERGLKPDTLYCYDLELPADFVPRSTDGETEAFFLWPIEQVAEVVRETDAFKPNCDLVIIDFMIRHGLIPPDHPDYLALVAGLRGQVGFPTLNPEGHGGKQGGGDPLGAN